MAIRKTSCKHDACSVQVEWLDPTQNHHYAKLVCIDKNCKHKRKWIQWLSLDDAITLVDDFGVAQTEEPVITSYEDPY